MYVNDVKENLNGMEANYPQRQVIPTGREKKLKFVRGRLHDILRIIHLSLVTNVDKKYVLFS